MADCTSFAGSVWGWLKLDNSVRLHYAGLVSVPTESGDHLTAATICMHMIHRFNIKRRLQPYGIVMTTLTTFVTCAQKLHTDRSWSRGLTVEALRRDTGAHPYPWRQPDSC